jgi:hypothetical protein
MIFTPKTGPATAKISCYNKPAQNEKSRDDQIVVGNKKKTNPPGACIRSLWETSSRHRDGRGAQAVLQRREPCRREAESGSAEGVLACLWKRDKGVSIDGHRKRENENSWV